MGEIFKAEIVLDRLINDPLNSVGVVENTYLAIVSRKAQKSTKKLLADLKGFLNEKG